VSAEANPLELSSWESFLHNYIVPLNALSEAICSVIEQTEKFNGKPYAELDEFFKEALVAELKMNGEYSENALAGFYRDLIGIRFEDPKLYVEELKVGTKRLTSKVKVGYVNKYLGYLKVLPRFVWLSRTIHRITSVIIRKMKERGFKVEEQVEIERPEDLVDAVRRFLELVINTTINRNKFALLAWTLRKITERYLIVAHPDISAELLKFLEVEVLRDFGKEGYKVYGYRDFFSQYYYDERNLRICANGVPCGYYYAKNSWYAKHYGKPTTIGGALCRLTEAAFTYIKDDRSMLDRWFRGVQDEEHRYIERVLESLEKMGWEEPEYVKDIYAYIKDLKKGSLGSSYGSPFKFLIVEESGVIRRCKQWIYGRSYADSGIEQRKFSRYLNIYSLLDTLSPAMFLGLFDVAFGEDSTILLVRRE